MMRNITQEQDTWIQILASHFVIQQPHEHGQVMKTLRNVGNSGTKPVGLV